MIDGGGGHTPWHVLVLLLALLLLVGGGPSTFGGLLSRLWYGAPKRGFSFTFPWRFFCVAMNPTIAHARVWGGGAITSPAHRKRDHLLGAYKTTYPLITEFTIGEAGPQLPERRAVSRPRPPRADETLCRRPCWPLSYCAVVPALARLPPRPIDPLAVPLLRFDLGRSQPSGP